MPKSWAQRISLAIAGLALAGTAACGSDSPPPPPSSTTVAGVPVPGAGKPCVGEQCSGLDPNRNESGCDGKTIGAPAFDAIPGQSVTLGGFMGKLGLRKSNPSACPLAYWSLVTPSAANTAPFTTWVEVDGRVSKSQVSEPGDPTVSAWSKVLVAKEGQSVRPCISSGSNQYCLPAVRVVS